MNSRSFQIFIALSIPIIVIISVLLLISFEKKTQTSSSIGDFPYTLWADSPKNCIGNTYNATIEIDSQLAMIQDDDVDGIVVLVRIESQSLPIFIPRSLETSVYPKQKFNARLYINKNGSVQAEALNKF